MSASKLDVRPRSDYRYEGEFTSFPTAPLVGSAVEAAQSNNVNYLSFLETLTQQTKNTAAAQYAGALLLAAEVVESQERVFASPSRRASLFLLGISTVAIFHEQTGDFPERKELELTLAYYTHDGDELLKSKAAQKLRLLELEFGISTRSDGRTEKITATTGIEDEASYRLHVTRESGPSVAEPLDYRVLREQPEEEGLLSARQEQALGRIIQDGLQAQSQIMPDSKRISPSLRRRIERGRLAEEMFVLANQRLVEAIAQKFARRTIHLKREDLVQEGNIMLLEVIRRFDPERGTKFSGFAYRQIARQMKRATAYQEGTIRLPDALQDEIMKIHRVTRDLKSGLKRQPKPAEIADALGCDVGELEALLSFEIMSLTLSMELPTRDKKGAVAWESNVNEDRVMSESTTSVYEEEQAQLREVLSLENFKLHELYIMSIRHGIPLPELAGTSLKVGRGKFLEYDDLDDYTQYGASREAAARKFGITKIRLDQMEAQVFKKLQRFL